MSDTSGIGSGKIFRAVVKATWAMNIFLAGMGDSRCLRSGDILFAALNALSRVQIL
jgi:hypothetical protein